MNEKLTTRYLVMIVVFLILIWISNIWISANLKIEEIKRKPNYDNLSLQAGVDIIINQTEKIEEQVQDLKGLIARYENAIDSVYYSYNDEELELTYWQKLDDIAQHTARVNFFEER